VIASVNKSQIGYDPYNSADRPQNVAARVTKTGGSLLDRRTDELIRRGFKILARGGDYVMASPPTQLFSGVSPALAAIRETIAQMKLNRAILRILKSRAARKGI
jgi:hypothetical protein